MDGCVGEGVVCACVSGGVGEGVWVCGCVDVCYYEQKRKVKMGKAWKRGYLSLYLHVCVAVPGRN